ncbi:hypothetical protein CL689_02695 [Candidatus Saccharibacteria bacterium]|nr:hypothetical protein [Candidatus Saccharibacteria bacterium]
MKIEAIHAKSGTISFLEKSLRRHRLVLIFFAFLLIADSVFLFQRFDESEYLSLGFLGVMLLLCLADSIYRQTPPRKLNALGISEQEVRLTHLYGATHGLLLIFWFSGMVLGAFFILFMTIDSAFEPNLIYHALPTGITSVVFFAYPLVASQTLKKIMNHDSTPTC